MRIITLIHVIGLIFIVASNISLAKEKIKTAVVTQENANITHYDGSKFFTYFEGDTAGTTQAITGVAIIQPNNEIHPAHKHEEEEYLMIIEGNGEWTVGDKTFKANSGDILYAAPNDLHGLFNTGKTPLKFVVFKWKSK